MQLEKLHCMQAKAYSLALIVFHTKIALIITPKNLQEPDKKPHVMLVLKSRH